MARSSRGYPTERNHKRNANYNEIFTGIYSLGPVPILTIDQVFYFRRWLLDYGGRTDSLQGGERWGNGKKEIL
jgi:hypothetical protein